MPLDLSGLEQPHFQTITLSGALDGFEVRLRHRTLAERERFRGKLISHGIMKQTPDGDRINQGRMSDFIKEMARDVIVGWTVPERFRNADAKDVNPEYSADEFAKVLNQSPESVDQISRAIQDENAFFSANGDGSTG